jgi:hypothetical protein
MFPCLISILRNSPHGKPDLLGPFNYCETWDEAKRIECRLSGQWKAQIKTGDCVLTPRYFQLLFQPRRELAHTSRRDFMSHIKFAKSERQFEMT